ncbi:MAG: hypothetical protein IKJ69_03945 [Clostridia bacterium]|nr:hypothetical protein [Clostridia bacterium]
MIRFILDKNALYDCVLTITDIYGTREHFIPMVYTEDYNDRARYIEENPLRWQIKNNGSDE